MYMGRHTFSFEMMFTRPVYGIDLAKQNAILTNVCRLFEQHILRPTLTRTMPLTLDNLREAEAAQQSGKTVGKMALVWPTVTA